MKVNALRIGTRTINLVSKTMKDNNICGKILYVSDAIVDSLYGETVRTQILSIGTLKVEMVDNNSIAYSMQIAERVIATDVDCIVAMGGGKVLDVCKYAAYIAKKPLMSIPTTAANDGIASPIAVLKRQDGLPKSLGCAIPTMMLVDINIICSAPKQLIKAGIGDTVSNYMALRDWDFAVSRGKDTMNGYAYLMSKTSLDALMKTTYNSICPEFVEVLINSLVLSGIAMDFSGSSRPVSGSEHCFSHALDYYAPKKNLHGIQVALGTIAMLKLIREDYSDVLSYLRRFDVDVNPRNLGIDEDTFITCMQKASSMRKGRYTHLDEIDLENIVLRTTYRELVEEL